MDKSIAESLLQIAVNDPEAFFRTGQWEAIDALVNRRRRLMVVQRTGWGKSLIYFLSTRIMRDRNAGPTIIISPLLALMRNQIEAARRLNICAETINSANHDQWAEIKRKVLANNVDAVLISPERLANESFIRDILLPISGRIGLFVIDEAHCISDWGHDFRPDYRRLVGILQQLPPNIPLLCTTATANNRVIDDVRSLLGEIELQRGALGRKSLVLQTLRLPDRASRLAWLSHYVPKLPGTGIIYALTKRDAAQVSSWLNSQGIVAPTYYSDVNHPEFDDSAAYRQHLETQLFRNEVKALVATSALGMGYDKPDLGFVIHYQAPASVISYYQQVGRAGRGINRAYGVLMHGEEDDDIHAYFRESNSPDVKVVNKILEELSRSDGLTINQLVSKVNVRHALIEHTLKILNVESPSPILLVEGKWHRTAVKYQVNQKKIQRLNQQRQLEWQEIRSYIGARTCLMAFLQEALDDPESAACGRCAVCRGKPVVDERVDPEQVLVARRFMNQSDFPFRPNRLIPRDSLSEYGFSGLIPVELQAETGRILSRWNDTSWGKMVATDKHDGFFRDELVEALAEMIEQRWKPTPKPQWVTCVPSVRHPDLVPSFARRLAARLGLPFLDAIGKARNNDPQKLQQNSLHQCRNLDGVFTIAQVIPDGPLLLIDDIVDSGWTMTILAILLRKAGAGPLFPVALASTSPYR